MFYFLGKKNSIYKNGKHLPLVYAVNFRITYFYMPSI